MMPVRLSAIVIGLLLADRAAAQPPQDNRPSHVPVPMPRGVDLQKLIAERLGLADQSWPDGISKLQSDLNRMLQQLRSGDPRAKSDTEQQLRQLLQNNPGLQERLREFARNNPQVFDRLVDSAIRENPEFQGKVDRDALLERLEQFARPQEGERRPRSPRPAERGPNRANPGRTPRRSTSTSDGDDDPAVEQYRQNIARNLSKLADRFDQNRLAPSLRESPAVNHLLERLANSGIDALGSGSAGEGLDAQLARWQRRFEGLRDWVPDKLPEKVLDYVPPTFSDLPRPNFRMPRIDLRGAGLPSGALRASGGLLDFAQFFLFALLFAAFGFVLWRLFGARAAEAVGLRRGLGPWPLDPAQVASRADLMKAFEYLSLLRCGEQARAWHHRAIAAGLGGTQPERRAAAERLAELYEHARYAPQQASALSDGAVLDARRHLTYLAGAGPA
jgi:hypothetical protein